MFHLNLQKDIKQERYVIKMTQIKSTCCVDIHHNNCSQCPHFELSLRKILSLSKLSPTPVSGEKNVCHFGQKHLLNGCNVIYQPDINRALTETQTNVELWEKSIAITCKILHYAIMRYVWCHSGRTNKGRH